MIVGNPDKFAIMADVVDEWNYDNSFNNGIMFFWVNALVFPQELQSITLNSSILQFYKAIQNIVENDNIFSMDKDDAFKALCKLVYPEDRNIENDYRFQISPLEFNDNNHLIFAVSDGNMIRILASSLIYDTEGSTYIFENMDIIESFITVADIRKMISDIENGEMKEFI